MFSTSLCFSLPRRPFAVLVLTWDNIAPRMLPTTTTFSYPADIRIELFRDDDLVTVICHSMPNIGMQCCVPKSLRFPMFHR